ncbi:MAG: DUF4910 domain-containing protein [Thermoplasmata archaeon]|jgi:hypothetical protein|nr:DUF4910 domain-containing protein [Thermoplasmata archaeon]
MDRSTAVREELSGSRAKHFVADITRYHRIQGSTMYHEAALYMKERLEQAGADEVHIEQFPADGKHMYWTHVSPIGWTARSAELRLVAPEERLLVSYEDIPQSLHTFSQGTGKGGVEADLVDVGAGTSPDDYKGKSVKGKLVLTTGRGRKVMLEAVGKRGAAGVLTDGLTYEFSGVREHLDIPDAHAYQGLWPTAKEKSKMTFGFSLSKRQGNELRALLKAGKKVRLKAVVDADLHPGHEEVVVATIRGRQQPGEEVVGIAHLCHPKPGANDNASGSGALLEVVRTITSLIRSKKIERPKRTMRFLWVPETLGITAYLSQHEELKERLLAGVNLDMVGEDQQKCGSTLTLERTPDSVPSYLNDLMESLLEAQHDIFDAHSKHGWPGIFRTHVAQYGGGSDYAEFNESTFGVPCVGFVQWPDKYYHTSMDTIENVSEDSLARIGWIAAVGLLTIADADRWTALNLANESHTRGMERLAVSGREASAQLLGLISKGTEPEEFSRAVDSQKTRLEHVTWREQEAVRSVLGLAGDSTLKEHVEKRARAIAAQGEMELECIREMVDLAEKELGTVIPPRPRESKAEAESRHLVPSRRYKGTLAWDTFRERVGDKRAARYDEAEEDDDDLHRKIYEAMNLADGKRSVHEIVRIVSAEFGPTEAKVMVELMKDMDHAGLVKLARKR